TRGAARHLLLSHEPGRRLVRSSQAGRGLGRDLAALPRPVAGAWPPRPHRPEALEPAAARPGGQSPETARPVKGREVNGRADPLLTSRVSGHARGSIV